MLYDTPEKMARRRAELDQEKIKSLMRRASKGDKSAVIRLQSYYGIDADFLPGFDDGEGPAR